MMEKLVQDIRYSIRSYLKSPGFTVVALLTLALGIGANSAIFSVVNAVLLRSLPLEDPDKVLFVWSNNFKESNDHNEVSFPDLQDWKSQNNSFEAITGYAYRAFSLTGDREPEPIQGVMVTPDFSKVAGVQPITGRVFTADDEHANVVILGNDLWRRRYNSDASIVGQDITMSNRSYTVIGVMPAGFKFPRKDVEAWTTFASAAATPNYQRRSYHFLRVLARLKPGVSFNQAQTEMSTIAGRLEQQFPESNTGLGTSLVPVRDELLGAVSPRLFMVWGAVGLVLLIACANLANMLLARTTAREREFAIRTAVGATRWRIIRQLITESLLMSLAGGILGLILALIGIRFLVSINPGNIPRLETVTLDVRSVIFTFLIAVFTGLIFGLVPALLSSKPDLNTSLKEGGRGVSGSVNSHRLQNLVIVSEIALALMLLIGAGLVLRSFMKLSSISLGFEPKNVLSMYIAFSRDKYPERPQQQAFLQRITDKIEELPGVEAASIGMSRPPDELYRRDAFIIEGRPEPDLKKKPSADFLPIGPHYFRALKMPLVSGREFTEFDKDGAPKVTIINETMVRRFFPNENPIGKRINLGDGAGDQESSYEIVGVVGDVKYSGLTDDPHNQMYLSYHQQPLGGVFVFVRTTANPATMKDNIRRQVFSVDFEQPVRELQTVEEGLASSLAQDRFNMSLLSVFAALALILTMVGVYGVIAYSVAQRTREIGIRMAMGATQGAVMKLILSLGLKLASIGVIFGLVAAFALTRIIESLLYEVSATDPFTYLGMGLLVSIVALLASFIPARRAANVDPMKALRQG